MNLEIISSLEKARGFISNPKNWKNGAPLLDERNAGIHCSLTAIYDADGVPKQNYIAMNSYLRRGMIATDSSPTKHSSNGSLELSTWNDSHTHEQVLVAFDKAIEFAKEEYEAAKLLNERAGVKLDLA